MKKTRPMLYGVVGCAVAFGVALPALCAAGMPYPVCNAAVCPERANDMVWENDKFGMRAYGPGEYHRWSGFDVFNKNTASNVCIQWTRDATFNRHDVTPNFHQNLGHGMDNYTMGASRGVGGIALYGDGEWKTYPDWVSSRILHTGPDYCEFELVYPAFSAAGKMTCHITLKRGERFFRNDVSFERMPKDFLAGPGIDLEPKRDHKGSLVEGPGLVSLFEDPKGKNGKDGSTMEAIFVSEPSQVTPMTDNQNCRVLAFRGKRKFTYWAGAGWSLAGEITTAAQWHECVRNFRRAQAFAGTDAWCERTAAGVCLVRGGRTVWNFEIDTPEGRPFIHPMLLPSGAPLTDLRPTDHVWHLGCWFSWKYINGVNYWEPADKRRKGCEPEGRTRVVEKSITCDGAACRVLLNLAYGPRGGRNDVLDEVRTVVFDPPDERGGYAVTFNHKFRALEDVMLDRTPPHGSAADGKWGGGYAGFTLRLDPAVAEAFDMHGSAGGATAAEVSGVERRKIEFASRLNGERISIVQLAGPDTARFCVWPDKRMVNPSPVFSGPIALRKGETLKLAYRIIVDAASARQIGRLSK